MSANRVLDKMKDSLSSREQVLLWLEEAKASGEYISYVASLAKGCERPPVPSSAFDDREALLLWRLIHEANGTVWGQEELIEEPCFFAMAFIQPLFSLGRRRPVKLRCAVVMDEWRERFGRLGERIYVLRAAIARISRIHAEGHEILFVDSRAVLDERARQIDVGVEAFNSRAEYYNWPPLALNDVPPQDDPRVISVAEEITAYAKAKIQ